MSNKTQTGSPLSTSKQRETEQLRSEYFEKGVGSISDKLNSISRFQSRQYLAKDLAYSELFNQTKGVLGSILECGVYYGNGLMRYALLSSALEPYNYQCQIIGFDTFEGDLGVTEADKKNELFKRADGDYFADSFEDLKTSIEIYNQDRPLNHLEKVKLVKGDIRQSSKKYIKENPSLCIRILHLSMNIYEPTKEALDSFIPYVSKGGIVVVHGLNYTGVGASKALLEFKDYNKIELKTFEFYPNICYFKM